MTPRKCPSCGTELEKAQIPGRRNILRCPKEQTLYRLKTPRKKRSTFDIDDQNTWHSTCVECGSQMDYYNYKYHCNKCGHTLYV